MEKIVHVNTFIKMSVLYGYYNIYYIEYNISQIDSFVEIDSQNVIKPIGNIPNFQHIL